MRSGDRRGRRAERLAGWLLRLKGYRILARRYDARVGEIDLVARRGGVLVFAEVKLRPAADQAVEALRPAQRQRIERAAEAFLRHHPELAAFRLRFDVIAVAPWRWPRHLPDAWRP